MDRCGPAMATNRLPLDPLKERLAAPFLRSLIRSGAALACALAISSVPILSSNVQLSFIPQILALLAVGLAGLTLLHSIPRIHTAMVAYLALVAFSGLTLLWEPEVWEEYLTLAKVSMLALAAHVVFRSSKELLLLFGCFCLGSVVTLALNWGELRHLSSALGSPDILSEKDRFAGTFGNANSAGMYGVMIFLSGLIVFFNARSRARWAMLAIGLVIGTVVCYFSGSRKAMLGLGLVLLCLPWMVALNTATGRVNWVSGVVTMLAILCVGTVAAINLPFMDRLLVPLQNGFELESSSRLRIAMLSKAFELWTEQPFFGCGFDGFTRLSGFGTYSHTTFSEVLCNAGAVGLLLLSVFYLVPATQLADSVKRRSGSASARLSLGLVTFWALFTLFSVFAVMLDSRTYIAIYAAMCGYLQACRPPGHYFLWRQRWSPHVVRAKNPPASVPESQLVQAQNPAIQMRTEPRMLLWWMRSELGTSTTSF